MQLLEWVHQNFRLRRSSIRMRFMLRLRVVSISGRLEEISQKGFDEYIRRGFYRALCSLHCFYLNVSWFVFMVCASFV